MKYTRGPFSLLLNVIEIIKHVLHNNGLTLSTIFFILFFLSNYYTTMHTVLFFSFNYMNMTL